MKTIQQVIVLSFLWTLASTGLAQTASDLDRDLKRMSVKGMEDLGKVKLLAERGNISAQLKIADACMVNRLYASALKWYSAAEQQGALEARYQKGHLLLFGSTGSTPDQNVIAKPTEGLHYIYRCATNRHAAACFDMALALKDGVGCSADTINAYAWFSLCKEGGNTSCLNIMNTLALQLSTENIRDALARARKIKAGDWPPMPSLPSTRISIKLKLSGVVNSAGGKLAIINKSTLSEGETSQFMSEQKELVNVTCQKINADSVEVLVAGETQPRTLTNATSGP